jgi:sigma-E factor negative regulatory protein RseA
MTDKLREQISALADDALPDGEHELLLRRFAAEKSLRSCWERYHLIGESMRKTLPAVDTRGFADRVMEALGDAPLPAAKPARQLDRFLRAAAGVAVAASVAVVAVVGLKYDNARPRNGTSASEIVPVDSALPGAPLSLGGANSASWDGTAPEVQASLRSYLVNHDVVTYSLQRQGNSPYRYIGTVDTQRPYDQPDQEIKPKPRKTPRRH